MGKISTQGLMKIKVTNIKTRGITLEDKFEIKDNKVIFSPEFINIVIIMSTPII
jgi:hypothetical protein